jgi:hypothetical protein
MFRLVDPSIPKTPGEIVIAISIVGRLVILP